MFMTTKYRIIKRFETLFSLASTSIHDFITKFFVVFKKLGILISNIKSNLLLLKAGIIHNFAYFYKNIISRLKGYVPNSVTIIWKKFYTHYDYFMVQLILILQRLKFPTLFLRFHIRLVHFFLLSNAGYFLFIFLVAYASTGIHLPDFHIIHVLAFWFMVYLLSAVFYLWFTAKVPSFRRIANSLVGEDYIEKYMGTYSGSTAVIRAGAALGGLYGADTILKYFEMRSADATFYMTTESRRSNYEYEKASVPPKELANYEREFRKSQERTVLHHEAVRTAMTTGSGPIGRAIHSKHMIEVTSKVFDTIFGKK